MAIIDTKRDVVVVRIVYDGPPLSGKTTSIHALAEILGKQQNIFSPDNGLEKTLYFDWLEYVGGFFKGYGISCQIITVPGQLSFEDRRHFLLQSADAVIFVLDAHVNEQNIALTYFQDLQKILAPCSEDAAIKVVIQANKQDQKQVLPSEQLKDNFKNHKIIESTATLGQGVREAFVVAVRFAVERTEELMAKGKLQMGEPDIVSGEQLLTSLQQSTSRSKEQEMRPEDKVLKKIAQTPEAILPLEVEEILTEETDEDVAAPLEATEVARSVDSSDEEAIIIDFEENQEVISTESTLEADKITQPIEPEEVTESLAVLNEADDELLKATAELPETLLVPEAEETLVETPVDSDDTPEISEMPEATINESDETQEATLESAIKADEILHTLESAPPEETTDDEALREQVAEETLITTTQNNTEQAPVEEEEELIFSDEPPASAEELAHEFALSETETLERKDLPQRPQKDISAQWLWPPLAGQQLLQAVCKPNFKLSFQEEDELWCFQVDKKWYGFSKLEWHYPQVTQAREAFRAQISLHLQCSLLLSKQRGIIVVQEPQQSWRLWQLVKYKYSLAAELTQALQVETGAQLAQTLFRYAVYYTIALQKSCHCASQLVFNLDNFALEAEQPVYLGLLEPLVVMDEQLSLKTTTGLIEALKQALRQQIHPWLSQLNIHEIISQLERIEGFEQQIILEGLIQLFDELAD
ncbi:MAG: hypothetical protein SVR94_08390 [Pseudomonadota bacterium]|nr:hypothetical protein [Pseudomonadota bacterium]